MISPLTCFCLLTFASVLSQNAGLKSDSSKEKSIVPPCQSCKILVTSFKKGVERTARGKFEGGDAAWEEQKLGSYSNSEVRLIEIQEKLCLGLDTGIDQCHSLAEETEQTIEDWWFKKQKEDPDLHEYLCINTLKVCCPENHYGSQCKPCPGYPDNVCSNNGRCKGSGTRKGNGQCKCDSGYTDENCTRCANNYYEAYKDATKLLCSPCHSACQGSCSQAGPKGCAACKPGWTMDTEKGCFDVNECLAERDVCQRNQFCVNNEGSHICLACDKSCDGCTGDGPDMCIRCAEGFTLEDNVCADGRQAGRDNYVSFTRYLTYFGLCVATCIIFQRSTIVASLIGLTVALYITVSEYMLSSDGKNNLNLDNFLMPPS